MAEKREHYIVDGYNVIHAWPELRGLAAEELAKRGTVWCTGWRNSVLTRAMT